MIKENCALIISRTPLYSEYNALEQKTRNASQETNKMAYLLKKKENQTYEGQRKGKGDG